MTAIKPPQYKIGDLLITTGEKICHIVGETDRAGVFLIEGDKIRWEFYADHVIPEQARHAHSKYEALWYTVSASFPPKLRRSLVLEIANSLFSALGATTVSAVDEYFRVVGEKVGYQAKTNQSFRYLLGALITLAIAGVIEVALGYCIGFGIAGPFLLAASAGGVGAIASVLQRIGSLEISQFAPLWFAFVQGGARVGLGVLFGLFFVVTNKANLVLGTFAENLYAVTAFSALAGISERFVPEIIRKLESGEPTAAATNKSV
jgi:hypothetical protein